MADKHIIAITIDERSVARGRYETYIPEAGDKVKFEEYHRLARVLYRNGSAIGYLAGREATFLRRFDAVVGRGLDLSELRDPGAVVVSSVTDPRFKATQPIKVFRKSYPIDSAFRAQRRQSVLRHELYLVMSEALIPGNEYTLEFNADSKLVNPTKFFLDDRRLRTESIHVNLYGYEPSTRKVASLSVWMGDGGFHFFECVNEFSVLSIDTGKVAFKGDVSRVSYKNRNDSPNASFNSADRQLSLDFSTLREPGRYRLLIEGVGVSFDFVIAEDLWASTLKLLLRGLFHQRSGIEMRLPYTTYSRPRNMHPADGHAINLVNPHQFWNAKVTNGLKKQNQIFDRIQRSLLPNSSVNNVWGGWMDAGDFDRRMTHLKTVRRLILLHEISPSLFKNMSLNIPESQNPIPDILDEAAWGFDVFVRTQGVYEPGGVSWEIESIEHPRHGETSWTNSLPTAVTPPTLNAAYEYAATAALLSRAIRDYDGERSDEYMSGAVQAMSWAKKATKSAATPDLVKTDQARMLAYSYLYYATEDSLWDDQFSNAVRLNFVADGDINYDNLMLEAFVPYLIGGNAARDSELDKQMKRWVLRFSDSLLDGSRANAYGVASRPRDPDRRMLPFPNYVLPLVIGHQLTGNHEYRDALNQSMQYVMGANPMNRALVSGLGERWAMPFHLDWATANIPMPAGIPSFGPAPLDRDSWGWVGKWAIRRVESSGIYPHKLLNWPSAERFFNGMWIAPVNEFTVASPFSELILAAGYLALQVDAQ
jgi:endoglucanase